MFSTLDLSDAFTHCALAKECCALTAFEVPGEGVFHFLRMPFGLCGAPATCQLALETVLRGTPPSKVFVYLDDILIANEVIGRRKIEGADRPACVIDTISRYVPA